MANEGSMGIGFLFGFLVFIILNALLGMFVPLCFPYIGCFSMDIGGALTGTILVGWMMMLGGIFTLHFIMAILVPLIAGFVAGAIAKGSASRGFTAGFTSSMAGYYIMLLIAILVSFTMAQTSMYGYGATGMGAGSPALVGTAVTGLVAQAGIGPMTQVQSPTVTPADVIGWVIVLLVIPMIIAVLAGIGGAIASAIFGSGGPMAGSSSSTIVNIGGSSEKKEKEKEKVLVCPKCDKENKASATFCEACGTRLRKPKEEPKGK